MSADQLSPIEQFAMAVIDHHRNDGYPGDVDGGWLQDTLADLGLLKPVTVTEACDPENCPCAECGDWPMECFRLSPDAYKLLALYRRERSTRNGG